MSLTAGVDAVTGTAGNDTISGARVDSVQTWNSTDKIDGGAGNDSFTAVIADDVTPTTGAITGVENITVTLTGTTPKAVTFGTADASKAFISGVETLTNLASTGVLTFAHLQEIPAITLNNTAAATVVSFAEGVLDGTADAITLNVIGSTGAVTLTPSAGEDIEALTVNATTAASTVAALGVRGGTVKSVVVTGDADLSFGTTASFHKVTSFDASEADGDITAVFDTFGTGTTNTSVIETGAGDDSLTISGMTTAEYTSISVNAGAGKDTVVVGTALSTKHTLDGGAGTDTLSINTGATSISVANVTLVNNQTSNFEVMSFANRVDVLDASSFSGFTDYVFTQASTDDAATDITGLTSANTLTFNANLTGTAGNVGAASSAAASTNALKLTATGTAQTAKITADATSGPLVLVGGVAGAGEVGSSSGTQAVGAAADEAIGFGGGFTALTIVADTNLTITGGKGGAGGAISGSDVGGVGGAAAAAIDNGTAVKTVTISGDGDVTISGGAVGATPSSGGAGGAASTNGFTGAVTVDASTLKGVLTIQGSTGQDSITGGTGNDVIRGGASNDTIILTAGGKDTVVFEATAVANAVDTISGFNVGSGKDLLNVNALLQHTGATVAETGDVIKITNLSGGATVANETVIIINFNAAVATKDFGSAAGFAELFGASKALSTTLADAAEALLVVQGTDQTQLYYIDNGGGGSDTTLAATEVELVGIMTGVTNADSFDFTNFII